MSGLAQLPVTNEDRGMEILARLRPVFAEKGFDGASMQDMARAAGMSVGNFYRYFPSKAAIVAAMVQYDLRGIEQDFAAIQSGPDMMQGLRAKIHERLSDTSCEEDGRLWAEITAAALRKPEIGEASCQMESEINRYMTTVFAAATGRSPKEAALRYGARAALIVMLVKASAMRLKQNAGTPGDLPALVLSTIDRILDEISADAVKG